MFSNQRNKDAYPKALGNLTVFDQEDLFWDLDELKERITEHD